MRVLFASFIVCLLISGYAMAGRFIDDFDDNELNEEYWFINKPSGWTVEDLDEINGQLEITDCAGGWEGIGVGLDIPLDLTLGETIVEADMFLRNTDGHFYFTSLKSEDGLWGNGLWAFNAIFDGGVTVFGFEEDKDASAIPEPSIQVDQESFHHYKIVLTPTGEAKKFDFLLSVDNGDLGEASGVLDLGTSTMPIDPTVIYLYLAVEQDEGVNEFTYIDNVEITSESIVGTIGAVDPTGKLPTTWAGLKRP
ncbi:hypothetical protein ACFL6S_18555 [Candidatus Poribacteria bacterium]